MGNKPTEYSLQQLANFSLGSTETPIWRMGILASDGSSYIPIIVSSEGYLTISYPNSSYTISNDDNVVASTKVITKTTNGISKTRTLSYNAGGNLLSVSAWS